MLEAPVRFGDSRQEETRMACKKCNGSLRVIRSCREVTVFCNRCGGRFRLEEYKDYLDAIEDFMGNVPCDRV
ncbi:dual CXXC motif small (seleno)protein [Desulfocurvus sp. DL9XJH121]